MKKKKHQDVEVEVFEDEFDEEFDEEDEEDEDNEEEFDDEEQTETKAESFLDWFKTFLTGDQFKAECNERARECSLPPQRVAQTFISKVLATLSDVLGVFINTAEYAVHSVIDLLSRVLHGAADLIVKAANAIRRIVTLNKTNIA